MKKVFILLLSCNFLFTQTINNDFLDGTIIFKLKEFVENDDKNLIKRVMNYASVKHIISKNLNDDEKILEIFIEIIQDLKNYELEQRISELESKFSKDMSESTFNEIKELKKQQKIN